MVASRNHPVGGTHDPRFDGVAEAFADNFVEHGEVGAAACIVVDGRVVADLWGGWADPATGRPWQADTLVNAFSVGKGMVAVLAARLCGDGVLGMDDPVIRWWPEYGAHDKGATTVADLLTHRAGQPALRPRMEADAMYDWDVMTAALADQRPYWEPGTIHGYHVNTFGYLVGEVMRRATGRSVGSLLDELVAGPLGADVRLGVPASEHQRIATFEWPEFAVLPEAADPHELDELDQMRLDAYYNPTGLSGMGVINTAAWREAQIPSTNTHASARGVARVYAALAAGGEIDGVRIVDSGALAAATEIQVDGDDLVLGRPSRFGLGFQLTQPDRPLGPNPGAFGHFGAGGSLGFCDPGAGIAFGYVMNRMGGRWQNPCNQALIDALYACLG